MCVTSSSYGLLGSAGQFLRADVETIDYASGIDAFNEVNMANYHFFWQVLSECTLLSQWVSRMRQDPEGALTLDVVSDFCEGSVLDWLSYEQADDFAIVGRHVLTGVNQEMVVSDDGMQKRRSHMLRDCHAPEPFAFHPSE
jgi:hypothetical protein